MTEIIYAGISSSYINEIKNNLVDKDSVFTPIQDENIIKYLEEPKRHAFLIGEDTKNPIRLAQAVYAADNSLSILIISTPEKYKDLKKALMYTPFIGNSVSCVPKENGEKLGMVLREMVEKTNQRRKYISYKKIPLPLQQSPTIEQLKREYINHFFEKAPVGALLLDKNFSILALNQYAAVMLDKEETDLLGSDFLSFFPLPQNAGPIIKLIEEDQSEIKRTLIYSKDPEKYIEVAISKVSLRGNQDYKTAIIYDVTNQFLKDQKIEKQVVELKKINNELDNFVYTASHDLKAPIANIEALISAFKKYSKEKLDEKERKYLELMEVSVNKFKITINDLTEISKLQPSTVELEPVNFEDSVEEVIFNISRLIAESSAKINTSFKVASIIYSKKDLNSILYNLLSNGIKYRSPDRLPEIEIKTERIEDEVLLSVKDNGLGFELRDKDKLFGMFKRLHQHVEGTGIGLYIVKKIIENHGGRIEVESEVGVGSVFKIYFRGQ